MNSCRRNSSFKSRNKEKIKGTSKNKNEKQENWRKSQSRKNERKICRINLTWKSNERKNFTNKFFGWHSSIEIQRKSRRITESPFGLNFKGKNKRKSNSEKLRSDWTTEKEE